jgi:5-methylcytosine-specific restriction endonuclease McrA
MMANQRAFDFKQWLKGRLRRLSYMHPERTEALKIARVGRNQYKCKKCLRLFTRKEIRIDHIIPIVPVSGWDTWDGLINRLFCSREGLQILCNPCHKIKTKKENTKRRELKKNAKND